MRNTYFYFFLWFTKLFGEDKEAKIINFKAVRLTAQSRLESCLGLQSEHISSLLLFTLNI
jgi:hypothetical protein